MTPFDLSAVSASHRPFVDWALSHVAHIDWRFPAPVPIEVRPTGSMPNGASGFWNGRVLLVSTLGPNWFNSTDPRRDDMIAGEANILIHEAAHAFDTRVMTPQMRQQIQALWGYGTWSSGQEYGDLCSEAFAFAFPAAFADEPVASAKNITAWKTHSCDRLAQIVGLARPGTVVVPPKPPPPEPPPVEVPVVQIPGVAVVHARESWQDPAMPVTGPTIDASAIGMAVIHYTASPRIPGDLPAFHRAMQRDYVTNRGYSLGYRWSVAQSGEVFQIRGWNFRAAANKDHNSHTEPILVLVDGDDAATPAAVASVRAIIAESQRRSGRQFSIVGHGQIGSTSCPGVGLRAQIAAGVFSPNPPTPQPPPVYPPTSTDEVTMIALDHRPGTPDWTALLWTGVELSHVVNGHADSVLRRAGVPRQPVTDAEVDGIIASSTTKTACPRIWQGTPRGAEWNSNRA